ncbi:MAG: hypothetical protein DRH06_00390 [Deltaproteobacteria bacterium]|nr:MAG: hypothetical protein DRH06_00390 [Deltaproteobacteria bacterium]
MIARRIGGGGMTGAPLHPFSKLQIKFKFFSFVEDSSTDSCILDRISEVLMALDCPDPLVFLLESIHDHTAHIGIELSLFF